LRQVVTLALSFAILATIAYWLKSSTQDGSWVWVVPLVLGGIAYLTFLVWEPDDTKDAKERIAKVKAWLGR